MDEDTGFIFLILFWATLAVAAFQRFWTIRRLRNRVDELANEAIAKPAPAPSAPTAIEEDEVRRINRRLQVLERIAVEKENSLSREIDDLRAAG
jgi:hypothetical protein